MDKVKTGIKGMDSLLDGGIPKGRIILLSGSSGTGKTIFVSHFIKEGVKNDENCVYVTLEQSKDKLIEDLKNIGIDFDDMQKKNKLKLIGGPVAHINFFKQKTKATFEDLTKEMEEIIKQSSASRFVLDSTNLFTMLFDDDVERRKALANLVAMLDKVKCTSILTCEVKENSNAISWHGFEEFVVDGVIVLHRIPFENMFERAVSVLKMRGVGHSQKVGLVTITKDGMEVYPDRQPYKAVYGNHNT